MTQNNIIMTENTLFFANQNTKNTEKIRHYPLLCLCRKQLADYVSREKKVSLEYPISNQSFLQN